MFSAPAVFRVARKISEGAGLWPDFDDGRMISDGGALLLREVNHLFNVTQRVADAFAHFSNS